MSFKGVNKFTRNIALASVAFVLAATLTPTLVGETKSEAEISEQSQLNIQELNQFDYSMYETRNNQAIDYSQLIIKNLEAENVYVKDYMQFVTIESDVDTSIPGNYTVTINYDDGPNRIKTRSKVEVLDIKPTISVGSQVVKVERGSDINLTELFKVQASEIKAGDLTSQVTVSDSYNINKLGDYKINLVVKDDEGNKATTTVVLQVRNHLPTIKASEVTHVIEESTIDDDLIIELANISAENSDGSYAAKDQITITYPDDFDTSKPRDEPYIFKAEVANKTSIGSEVGEVYFKVYVDLVAPVLYYDENKLEFDVKDKLPTNSQLIKLFGITAKEFEFGDTNIAIQITNKSKVLKNIAGEYPIEVTATDDDGQQVHAQLTVVITDQEVEAKGAVPEINSLGTFASPEGTELTDSSLYAAFNPIVTDDEQGLSAKMTHQTIDYSTTGTYQITFSVTDSDGNTTSKLVKLVITDVIPEITFTKNPVVIKAGDKINDYISSYGVVATELTEGDLTSQVKVEAPNISKPGSYNITFIVYDDEGNPATQTVRLVVNPA